MWNLSRATYHSNANMVAEKTIRKNMTYQEAINLLNRHDKYPIYIWHTDCMELYNPGFALIETAKYKEEYNKIKENR